MSQNKYTTTNKSSGRSTVPTICGNPLGDDTARGDDHLTGKYRGASHNKCNLNCQHLQSNLIPILFHNVSGYDCQIIFEQLSTESFNQIYKIHITPKFFKNYVSV